MRPSLLIILSFTVISISAIAQQPERITELNGLTDSSGTVHLFYRLSERLPYNDNQTEVRGDIWHLNTETGADTLLLDTYYDSAKGATFNITGYYFIDDDPSKYIYSWELFPDAAEGGIKRWDGSDTDFGESVLKLVRSNRSDSIFYAQTVSGILYKSTDAGLSWYIFDSSGTYSEMIFAADDPTSSNIFYAADGEGFLSKSVDTGKSYFPLSASLGRDLRSRLIFTENPQYAYIVRRNDCYLHNGTVLASQDGASTFSVLDPVPAYFYHYFTGLTDEAEQCNDCSASQNIQFNVSGNNSGTIYYSSSNAVFVSNDYGTDFSELRKMPRGVTGLYSSSGDEVYLTTNFNIYKVSADTLHIVASKPPVELLEYYPLRKGNSWLYFDGSISYGPDGGSNVNYVKKEITTDTVLSDGYKYYITLEPLDDYGFERVYERIDTATGYLIALRNPDSIHNQYLLTDLYAVFLDIMPGHYFGANQPDYHTQFNVVSGYQGNRSASKVDCEYVDTLFSREVATKYYTTNTLFGHNYYISSGFGLTLNTYEFDWGDGRVELKGCVIDGVVYGDTAIPVGVNDEINKPVEFELFQNYPNPFNPVTNISYTLPERTHVKLVVYDVLGREVASLVDEVQARGRYSVRFDAAHLASGVYFYRIDAGKHRSVKKLILTK